MKPLEEYPKSSAIVGNLLMLAWIGLGALGVGFISPPAGWTFLVIAFLMVYVVLRKLVCTNCCYYGKWCGIGWGKLSALVFRKGDEKRFAKSLGIKVAPAVYGLLSLIPLAALAFSLVTAHQSLLAEKILTFFALLAVSFYSGTAGRKNACARCKMRPVCPGSAVRTEK